MRQAIGITAAATLLLVAAGALARAPSNADPEFAGWFQSLRNAKTGAFCCDTADGHILSESQWRTKGDGFEAVVNGVWREVPKEAVLMRVDNPTGGAVIFYPPGGEIIFCFVRPGEA